MTVRTVKEIVCDCCHKVISKTEEKIVYMDVPVEQEMEDTKDPNELEVYPDMRVRFDYDGDICRSCFIKALVDTFDLRD